MEHIIDQDFEVVFLTETWLSSQKNSVTAALTDYGYNIFHVPRQGRAKNTGGGVGILAKKILQIKPIRIKHFETFGCSVNKSVKQRTETLTPVCLYQLDYESPSAFFEEFSINYFYTLVY